MKERRLPPAKRIPPEPSRSSAAGAYELLLTEIESGGLPSGTRLREAALAQRFRISRTPVREALKLLEARGLVVHEPHHGAVVASLDYGQVTELYFMRELLEGNAARLAAIHATATEIEVLRDMVARDRKIVGEPQKLAETNRVFHRQIRNSARNRFLAATLENLRLSLALLPGTTLSDPDRGAASLDEHQAIVDCMAGRDPDAAEAAARLHIRNAFRARIERFQGRSELL
jgi:DNA-binding GntR family transcriptional regulator